MVLDSNTWEVIMNNIYNDVLISDAKGKVIYANNSSEYWFGLKKEDLIGKSVYELEKKKVFYPSVTRLVIESNNRQTIVQTTSTGKKLLLIGEPIFDKNHSMQYIVTYSQDITDVERLKSQIAEVEAELHKVKTELDYIKNESSDLVAASKPMKQIIQTAKMVAESNATVLIEGESGVGKNILAKFIHKSSKRKGAFVEINCGALPENLLESELFGYAPGSFTGADSKGKKGLVEEAENGTLFLDEIGELPLKLQVKLLTLIQEKKFFKVGESKPRYVDFRLIAATNVNLKKKIKQKKFREDLYYRLSVIPLYISPLRERKEDLSELIITLQNKYNNLHRKNKIFHPKTVDLLLNYSWPGNIRELSNVIERLILTVQSQTIQPEHIPENISNSSSVSMIDNIDNKSLQEILDEVELAILKKMKEKYRTTTEMAKHLGISQPTVVRKMQKYKEHFS